MKKPPVRNRYPGPYLFHALVWLVYGVYNLMNLQGYVTKKGWLFALPPLLISMTLVAMLIYVNALLLVPKLLDKKKILPYILSMLALVAINTCLRSFNQQHWDGIVWPEDKMEITSYFKWSLFDGFWSILISTLLLFSLRWSDQRQKVKNIEVAQLQTELKYLRSQLNPHFLFNGLNTIYGNIDRSNSDARASLLQFADLLRYNLYEADADLVELGKEVAYLNNYVALQKARSNPNLGIGLDIHVTDDSLRIAPLLFIAFVENAFKFSTRDDSTDNFVRISLVQQDHRIVFNCINSCETGAINEGGIGLPNVKRRLDLLYKDRYTLDVNKDDTVFQVTLTINL